MISIAGHDPHLEIRGKFTTPFKEPHFPALTPPPSPDTGWQHQQGDN